MLFVIRILGFLSIYRFVIKGTLKPRNSEKGRKIENREVEEEKGQKLASETTNKGETKDSTDPSRTNQ